MRKVIAKIDLENIRRNGEAFLRLTGKPVCAVVKANGYGHGAEEVVGALEGIAEYFAVSLLDEAIAIRVAVCGRKILILTPPTREEEVVLAAKNGFVLTVGDRARARLIATVCEREGLFARVHLKANTGMNRYGMDGAALQSVCAFLSKQPRVLVEGLYSHIYDYDRVSAETQRRKFLQMQRLAKGYFPRLLCHLSATYGALLGEAFAFDMTRIGLGLYGYIPDGANDLDEELVQNLGLRKAMSVWAEVSALRTYTEGGVGYGKARVEEGTPLSVLRYGYADGFLRKQNNGVCGAHLQANTLCMDACVRKNTKGAKVGEWLPVLTDAAQTAKETDTISYEVLCAATRRAEMVYDDATFYRK